MMERGVGKMEVIVRDEFGVGHTMHVDPDATIESVHEQLRELTGVSRDTQVPTQPNLTLAETRQQQRRKRQVQQ